MSGGVVCYIERTPGGGGIRRLRLIAAGLARQWTAPEPASVSSVDSGVAGGTPPSVSVAKAGATWIAETLEAVGLKRMAAVCVDAEGSICAWLSATSPEPAVVRATIANSEGGIDGSGAGLGTARLLAGAESGAGFLAEMSVQALATLDPDEPKPGLSLRRSAPAAPLRKHRYAVLAIQDAIVRVLLDELDARAIEIDRVVSIWHAMAGGWDRAQPNSISDRLVSADSPGGAVILVEPSGRLVWAWTRAGELVAGGAMRLAMRPRSAPPPPEPGAAPEAITPITALAGTAETARRAPTLDADDEGAGSDSMLEFSTAEAGRLAIDWLSWSAQLGHCPQRVICLSSPLVCDGTLGPEALFAHLAKCWPGATIDGAVHDDPIGATIGRLAGLGPEIERGPAQEKSAAAELPYFVRPREALVGLSERPGRADRRLYQWIGVCFFALAALVGVLGWRVDSSIGAAKTELESAEKERRDALASAATLAPDIMRPKTKPEEVLTAATNHVADQLKYLKPPRPILQETVRVLTALNGVNDNLPAAPGPDAGSSAPPTEDAAGQAVPQTPPTPPAAPAAPPSKTILNEIEFSVVSGVVRLSVPDAETGPNILDKLTQLPGVPGWTGSTVTAGPSGSSSTGARTYVLTLLSWPDAPSAPGAAAGKPAAAPTAPAGRPGASAPADKPPTTASKPSSSPVAPAKKP